MDTYEPVHKSDLMFEDRKKALASLMFITEKRNGDIKARKVADGSKQRTYDGYDMRSCVSGSHHIMRGVPVSSPIHSYVSSV